MTDRIKKLQPKQIRFCQEYMIDLNGAQAAIRAGYSEKTAKEIACNLCADPLIQELIAELSAAKKKRIELTTDVVLRELYIITTSNLDDFKTKGGKFLKIDQWTEDMGKAVEAVQLNDDGSIRSLKLWSKPQAINMAGKHLGMFIDQKEVKVIGKIETVWTVEVVPVLAIEHKPVKHLDA